MDYIRNQLLMMSSELWTDLPSKEIDKNRDVSPRIQDELLKIMKSLGLDGRSVCAATISNRRDLFYILTTFFNTFDYI